MRHKRRWAWLFLALPMALHFGPQRGAEAQAPGSGAPATASKPSEGANPSESSLEERLRRMEDANRRMEEANRRSELANEQLRKQLDELSKKYDDVTRLLESSTEPDPLGTEVQAPSAASAGAATGRGIFEDDARAGAAATGSPLNLPGESSEDSQLSSMAGGAGGGIRNRARAQIEGNRRLPNLKLRSTYDYERGGFLFNTEDDEVSLRVRLVAQGDARLYTQPFQNPVSSGFYVPRTRIYFTGQMSRPIQYHISFQEGFDKFNLLNAYLNFDYDRRFQFRFGRFKAPYTYEFYKPTAMDLLAPERSLFNNNFGLNRTIGAQLWGEFGNQFLEYAVGAFNGGRNSYQPYNNHADLVAFLNFKPFIDSDGFLQHLNIGGSGAFGKENNPVVPGVLRTSLPSSADGVNATSASNSASVPFLAFNNNVTERGARSLWDLHLAYFYQGLSLLGSWSAGFDSYALPNSRPVALPVNGYFVQLGYLLTGETVTELTVIDPIKRFDLRPGHFGLGAIQPTARFSSLSIGQQVFNAGFADPNLWTNHVSMVDVGLNWYLNKMTKIYFDWEHAVFGDPVYYRPGPGLQKTSDMLWLRFQLYF